jgi:hypothetical protein
MATTRITATVSTEPAFAGAFPTLEPAQLDLLLTIGQQRDTEASKDHLDYRIYRVL